MASQADIWGALSQNQSGSNFNATSAAYPTFQNPYGIGSGSVGQAPGAPGAGGPANAGPSGPTAPTAAPLLGTATNVGAGAPAAQNQMAPGSTSYNPWDLKGQANSREF